MLVFSMPELQLNHLHQIIVHIVYDMYTCSGGGLAPCYLFFYHSSANEDFSLGLNNTLVFNEAVKCKSFSVAITDDSLSEFNEHFSVDLLLVDAQGYNIKIDPISANITIIDDDGKLLLYYIRCN